MNERFQNALKRIPQKTPPIWLMRQAGRYHRHYQELKATHTFMELCKSPELAARVALGPVEDFDFDVAILFSDILFPLEALGMPLSYDPGPKLGTSLEMEHLSTLKPVSEAAKLLEFQGQALQLTRKQLAADKSMIGFVGGPWTLFTYAAQGRPNGSLRHSRAEMALFRNFMEILVPLLKANLKLQFAGGAEVVMIFDTAAGELSAADYAEFVAPFLKTLFAAFPGKLGYYAKGMLEAHYHASQLIEAPLAGLGYDHRWSMPQVLRASQSGFVQGNFDEALLFCPEAEFDQRLRVYFDSIRTLSTAERAGWVCGLGHGVLPHTPEAHVRRFVEVAREVFS